jgi:hypothetical protein
MRPIAVAQPMPLPRNACRIEHSDGAVERIMRADAEGMRDERAKQKGAEMEGAELLLIQ